VACYNLCQGPVPGRGPAIEKHSLREFTYLSDMKGDHVIPRKQISELSVNCLFSKEFCELFLDTTFA
jgi:hypothetical protein